MAFSTEFASLTRDNGLRSRLPLSPDLSPVVVPVIQEDFNTLDLCLRDVARPSHQGGQHVWLLGPKALHGQGLRVCLRDAFERFRRHLLGRQDTRVGLFERWNPTIRYICQHGIAVPV